MGSIVNDRRFLLALLVTAVCGLMFKVSYFQQNQAAYLFPIIISSLTLAFSITSLIREYFDLCVDDFKAFPFFEQVPGIVITIVGVSLIELIGMYSSSFLVLVAITTFYSTEGSLVNRFIKSAVFSFLFLLVMYLIFNVLLNVQLPRGLMF
jgi:hypothetical protein